MSSWPDPKKAPSRSQTSHGFRTPSRNSARDVPKRSATPAVGSSSRSGSEKKSSSSSSSSFQGRRPKKSSRTSTLPYLVEQDEDGGGASLGSEASGGASSRRSDQYRSSYSRRAVDMDDLRNPATQEYHQQQSHGYWTWDSQHEGWYHIESDGSRRWAPREFA